MKFLDSITITFIAGNGGSGAVSTFQDWMQKKPRPDGGDGGNGGNIILKADSSLNTLMKFHGKKIIRAAHGEDGKRRKRHGKTSEDLCWLVPIGTLVLNEDKTEILYNFTQDQEQFLLVKGGTGGLGNANLMSNQKKMLRHSQPGTLGQTKKVVLDLRLLAQVALIGLPNAGKTSLLNAITSAKAQVGDYPFTTLIPNLGVLNYSQPDSESARQLIISDLPGIISGASLNKGLGNRFLKHAERSYLLLHVLDLSKPKAELLADFALLTNELLQYNSLFSEIPQIIVGNKLDIASELPKKEWFQESRVNILGVVFVSVNDQKNLSTLKALIPETLQKISHQTVVEKTFLVKQKMHYRYQYHWEKEIRLRKVNNRVWELSGKLFQMLLKKFDLTKTEDLMKFNQYLKASPIFGKLKEQGISDGDVVYVLNQTFVWKD